MDYETFGEHQWAETGIFDFLKALPGKILENPEFQFVTPSQAADTLMPVSAVHVPHPTSWADAERDLTAWLGNEMQSEAHKKLFQLQEKVNQCSDDSIRRDWLRLQTSDHFYYICTKWFADGSVHKYFNPWLSPYDAFINFMNVLSDFEIRIERNQPPEKIRQFSDEEQKEMIRLFLEARKAETPAPQKKKTKSKS
jgi:alpha-amylase